MSPINMQELLEEAKCYSCFGTSVAQALKLALWSRIATNLET